MTPLNNGSQQNLDEGKRLSAEFGRVHDDEDPDTREISHDLGEKDENYNDEELEDEELTEEDFDIDEDDVDEDV